MAIGDVTPKKLFQGPLSSGVTAVYTVPAGHRAQIVEMHVVNQSTTTDRKFNAFTHGTGTANQIMRNIPVIANTGISISDNKIILNAGEVLALSQDVGTDVIVTIYGIEEAIA